ncbi:hypothetical protein FLA_1251 [Filimonas lacunae]|nr:hypothetical protein FLA_1251 [Filimonas lacunae]
MPVGIAATIKVYCPANPAFTPITATIAAGSVSSIRLTDFKSMLVDSASNTILNRGIKIEASQMITAYYDESSERNPEIYALKGVNSLGTAFYIPGQRWRFNNTADNGTRKAYNAFDIVATEDNTVVTITPSRAIDGHAANVAFNVTLNKGQTYCCRASGQTVDDHLGSSTVVSNKPIAVTVVDDFVNLGGCSDAGGDQLVPVTIFGTEYAAVHGYIDESPYDRICVMATEDNTKVYLNGSTTVWKTLNKGQSEEYAFSGAPVYIKSDKAVSVMHVSGIGCELSYAVLPPLGACIGSKVVGIVRPGTYDCYLMLLVPVSPGIESSFSITTTAGTTAIAASNFASITGTTAWKYARVPLSTAIYPNGSFGKITSSLNVKFHAGIIYGKSGVGGSYGYFSNYAISPTVTPPNDTVFCNGTYTGDLKFTSTVNNSVFEWANDNTSIGLAAGGTGNIPSFYAVNPTDTIQYAHVSVVPRANDCDGIPRQFTIVVHPTPKLKVAATPKPVCVPSTVNITADSITAGSTAGMTLYYYTNRTATTTVANPKKIAVSGWYYIQGKSAAGCLSNIDSVRVTINDTPTVVITNPAAVCVGEKVDITKPAIVAGSTAGITFGYYTDPTSGVQYATPTAAPVGTYYIIGTNANGCTSTPMPVKVVEKTNATAADVSATAADVCIGSSATLKATSSLANPTFQWYSDAALTNLLATGASYNTPALNANTTYYISVSNADKCANKANAGGSVVAKVKQFATEADITTTNTSICSGASATLSVSSALTSPVFKWYRDKGLTDSIGTGTSYTATALTATTTYYVTVSNSLKCSNQAGAGDSVVVTVKPYATAADINAGDAKVCVNSTATLTASSSLASPVFNWYSDASLATFLATGASYTTAALSADKTYYVTVSNTATCANAANTGKAVAVTVKRYATAADITATAEDICKGTAPVLTATSSVTGAVFNWYSNAALTTFLGTGSPFSPAAISANTTYYVSVSGTDVCANKTNTGASVTVKVKDYATTADVSASAPAVCSGDASTITATSSLSGAVIKWYSNAALTDSIATGTTYTTPALTANTTYYVSVSNSAKCANQANAGASATVTVKPYATAADINTTNASICPGATAAALTVSSSTLTGATFKWYTDAALTNQVATGTSYTTPALTANTTYYVTVSSSAKCSNQPGAADSVVVTIKPVATDGDITASGASICSGSTAALTASSTMASPVFRWYSDASLSTASLLYTGATYGTAALTADKTYYVTVSNTATCANAANTGKPVTVTVKRYATAADITAAAADICKSTAPTLTATSSVTGAVFNWYSNAALTTFLGTGSPFTPAAISANTTYYVSVSGTDVCANKTNTGASVTVKVKDYATTADVSASAPAVCTGDASTVTATSSLSGAVFKWYSNAALTDSIGTGATYTTPGLTANTTYYVSVSNSAKCANQANAGASATVTVKPYATTADINTTNASICSGTTAALTVSSSTLTGATFKWYTDAALTNQVATGTSYTTPALTANTTYYVTVSSSAKCSNQPGAADSVVVTIKPFATAADITASGASICSGSTATLTAASTLTSPVYKWYSDASLSTASLLYTGASYTTAALTANRTYYVTVSGTEMCANVTSTGKAVDVIVKRYATAADITATAADICKGTSATLNASSTLDNPIFNWYTNATLTSLLGTGATVTTPALSANTTYYVTVSNADVCSNKSGAAATVTVITKDYAVAADITATATDVCSGNASVLSAKSSLASPVFTWYSNAALTDSIGTGATYTTAALTAAQTYYVKVSSTAKCDNKANAGALVTVKVKPYATAANITATGATVCMDTKATLSASSNLSSATIKWYRDAALTDSVGTGASFVTPVLKGDSTYYISVSNANTCGNLANTGAVAVAKVLPYATAADITANPAEICKNTTAVLSASSTLTNAVYKWYSNAALTTLVATNATYTTPVLSGNTTYYVSVSGAEKCANLANNGTAVTVKVKDYAVAGDITAIPDTICSGGTAVLSASSSLNSPLIKWYKSATLTDSVGVGETFTVSGLTATTTYYVGVSNADKCANLSGNGKAVQVKVNSFAIAADVTATVADICTGSNALITAKSTLANPTFTWYRNAALTDSIGTGATYTTSALTANTTYYVSVTNVDKCNNLANTGRAVTVTVKEYATPANISIAPVEVCEGTKAAITATSNLTGVTFKWYRDAALTDSVGVGAKYITNVLNADSTYYVSVSNTSVCSNQAGNGAAVTVKVKKYATAADITATAEDICKGTIAKLTATSSLAGASFKWFSNATMTVQVGIGDTYVTSALNVNTTYYVSVSNADKCSNLANTGAVVTVKVKPYATAADAITTPDTVCTGSTAVVSAASSLSSAMFTWYSNAALTDSIGTGATYSTPALTGNTTYYVSVSNADKCYNLANTGTPVVVKVNPYATATDVVATASDICTGSTAVLKATSALAGAAFTWYTDAALTDSVGTGASYTTSVLTAGTAYYVSVRNVNKCSNLANTGGVVTVKVKEYATAADVTVTSAAICTGSATVLRATSSLSAPTFKWYTNAALTDSVGIGATYTTPVLTTSKNYYVSVSNADKCKNEANAGAVAEVKVKPYATSADVTAVTDTVCTGSAATLTASSSLDAPTFKWYKSAGLADSVETGAVFVTPALTSDAIYYVSVSNADKCNNQATKATPVIVKVNAYATAANITVTTDTVCTGSSAVLSANSTLVNPTFTWYSNAALTDSVASGATYNSPVLTAGTTYYVSVSNIDRCNNLANTGKPVVVKVNEYATSADVNATAADICTGSQAVVKATSSLANPAFTWYSDAALSDSIGTGATYTSPVLSAGITYYVSVRNVDKCNNQANAGTPVTVKVKEYATATDVTALPDTICTGSKATLTATSSLANASFNWYTDAALSNRVFTGATYITPVLTAGTTYYVSVNNADKCNNLPNTALAVAVKVNTYAVAVDVVAANDTICKGTTATLTASSALDAAVFTWYTNAGLTDSVGTGATYTTPVLTAGTVYYIGVSNYDKCRNLANTGKVVLVKVNEYATSANVSASAADICTGSQAIVKATSNLANPTFTWYRDAALTDSITTGATYTTPVLTAGTTYYVSVSNIDRCNNLANAGTAVAVKVKEFATTADVSVVTDTVCKNTQATLTASSSLTSPIFKWYSNAALTDSVGTGATYVTPVLSNETTYYVSVGNADKCNNLANAGAVAVVKVNEYAVAADITVAADTVCKGAAAVLTATSNLANPAFTWYSNAALTNVVGTGATYTTPVLASNTTYYVSVSNVDKCKNLANSGASVVVKVNEFATAADIAVVADTVCTGSAATLIASSTLAAPVFTWYGNAALTDSVGAGPVYNTPVLAAGTTYYVSVKNLDKCNNLANTGKPVVVKVNEYATGADVSALADTICTGSTATVKASSSLGNPTFTWYSNAALTDSVATGVTYTTPVLTAGTTYYVSVRNVDKCNNLPNTGTAVTVKVKEYATTADVNALPDTICTGNTATLTAATSLPAATIKWYSNAALTNQVGVGVTYVTPALTANTTYYVSVSNVDKCNNQANAATVVDVRVNSYATGADLKVVTDTTCKGATATLTASSSLANPTFTWYTDAALTNAVGTGASFTTPALATHAIYYVSVSNIDKCNNKANTGVTAIVKVNDYATAANVSVAPDSICTGSSATLTAKSNLPGAAFKWYSNAALTNLLAEGATYTTPVLTANATYYVSVSNDQLCFNEANRGGVAQVVVKEYATSANIAVKDTTVCSGTSAALTATSTGVQNPVYTWYLQPGGQPLQSSTSEVYNTGAITAATTYYVTVKGTNLCEIAAVAAKPANVGIKTLPVITTQPKGVSSICEGRATGFSLVATGDNIKYQWQVNDNKGGGFVNIAGATSSSITLPVVTLDMSGYQYRCVVSNDCAEVFSNAIVLTVNAAPKIISDPKDAIVCENGTASFSVTASGSGNITYLWQLDRKDGLGFIAISGANAATYSIAGATEAMTGYAYRCIVSGTCAPTDTSNAGVLTVPVARIGDIGTQVLCNNTVTTEVPLQSSVPGTSYTWVNTNTRIGLAASGTGTISSFTAINRGEHPDSSVVTVTPVAYGCKGVAKSFKILVNPSPLLSSAGTERICSGGTFNYTATSETQGTSFNWSRAVVAGVPNVAASGNGNISETLTNTTTAPIEVVYNYTLVSNSCSFTQPVTLTVKPLPVAAISGDTACAESKVVLSGSSTLTGSTFVWTTPAGKTATGSEFIIAGAKVSEGGVYTLVATKDYCSSVPVTYNQVVKPLPGLTVAGDTSVCIGQSIVLTASSDIGADRYAWTGPAGFSSNQPGFTITNVTTSNTGKYSLVAEKDGCLSNTKVVAVQVNTYPSVSIQRSSIACENGSVWVKAISSLPLSTYIWQGPGVTGTGQEMVIKPITGTTLKVYVVVSKSGCAIKDSVEFAVKKSPAVAVPPVEDVCQSVSPFKIPANEVTGIAGSGVFSGASVTADGLFTPTIAAGTYVITYTYTSSEGCADAKSISFKVYPMPGVNAGPDKTMYAGANTRLDGSIAGNYTSYTWSLPGDTLLNYNTLMPTVSPEINTSYILSAVNSYGCKAVDTVDVTVLRFRIPNSFSPNGDGFNDNWNIPGLSKYPNSRVEVYNRWGTKLFVSKGYNEPWDGKYNGSYVPAATYYYLIYLNDGESLKEKPIAGWIEVMR